MQAAHRTTMSIATGTPTASGGTGYPKEQPDRANRSCSLPLRSRPTRGRVPTAARNSAHLHATPAGTLSTPAAALSPAAHPPGAGRRASASR